MNTVSPLDTKRLSEEVGLLDAWLRSRVDDSGEGDIPPRDEGSGLRGDSNLPQHSPHADY